MSLHKRCSAPTVASGLSVLAAALLISGCGMLDSKKADYKTIQKTKPLDVPPELSAPAKDDRYAVSELGSKGTTYSNYTAERAAAGKTGANPTEAETKPVATVLPKIDKVRLEREGNYRWVVMEGAPDQVWAELKRFVEARGLVIKKESPALGTLETDWAEKAVYVPEGGFRGLLSKALGSVYSASERDKFLMRLEAGREKGTTEVFIGHRGIEEVFVRNESIDQSNQNTRWQPRPINPELEAEMLGHFMQFVGVEEKKATVMVAGVTAAAPTDRARLIDADGKLGVELDERFDRAWRRVGLALDRNGFTVEDRDRAKGIYFVRYDDPFADKKKNKGSWIDALAFWRDDKANAELDKTPFRIVVSGASEELTKVSVLDGSGAPLNNATARGILDIVRKELK